MTRVYIAGPMSKHPLWNFPAFRRAATNLRCAGFEVVSPAEMDVAAGFRCYLGPEVDQGFDLAAAMKRDLLAVDSVDLVVLLPGWESSVGANLEHDRAVAAGIPTRTLTETLAIAKRVNA
jgi:hypothetical protein